MTIRIAAEIVFWTSLGFVVYTYAAYPILIWVLSKLFGRDRVPPTLADAECPRVSLLIAAHNEEEVIEARIQNALALDYPAGKLEVIIGSDGSSDRTNEIVRKYEGRVRLLAFDLNRGKATTLNDAFKKISSDVVLLSDANTFTEPGAARSLVRWFSDPDVGAVCGRLVLTDPATGRNVDSVYWRYETFLKLCEGRLDALLGANGAIYAIRRPLFQGIPNDTIVDDFVIPLLGKLSSGCSIRYDADAVANEEAAPDMAAEFKRRSRIGAGGFQAIGLLWPLLLPRYGWTALAFGSHKLLRWLCPFLLFSQLAANVMLLDSGFYRIVMAAQATLLALSALGRVIPGTNAVFRLLRLPALFTSMNIALAVGFWRWASGSQGGTWERTSR